MSRPIWLRVKKSIVINGREGRIIHIIRSRTWTDKYDELQSRLHIVAILFWDTNEIGFLKVKSNVKNDLKILSYEDVRPYLENPGYSDVDDVMIMT